jgi:hypothetical protein
MPGNVSNTAPATVLPQMFCTAFQQTREIALQANEYRNGETQRALQVASSRRKWTLAARLSPSALATLRAFFLARRGGTEPFYYYDPFAVVPFGSNYDPTGANAAGRVTVRFDGPWQQSMGMARTDVQIILVEVN